MTRIIQHLASENVVAYRKAHEAVNIFKNSKKRYTVGKNGSNSMGITQSEKYLKENMKLLQKQSRAEQKPEKIFRRFPVLAPPVNLSDMLPLVVPGLTDAGPGQSKAQQERAFRIEVKQMLAKALNEKSNLQQRKNDALKEKNKRVKGGFVSNRRKRSTAENQRASALEIRTAMAKAKEESKRKAEDDRKRILKEHFDAIEAEKESQLEYDRKVMVERIAYLGIGKCHGGTNYSKKTKHGKLKNVTKAITPRFGRSRDDHKKSKKRKGDGLLSHVKITKAVDAGVAAANGDPYEGLRAQVCIATPKPSAGFHLVWMW